MKVNLKEILRSNVFSLKKKFINHEKAKKQIMQGKKPMFAPTKEKQLYHWRNYDKIPGRKGTKRNIENYLDKERNKGKSEAILKKIYSTNIDKTLPVLEIGCNAGRNLNYLFENGFTNLYGIEINPTAIKILKEKFPEMGSKTKFFIGALEDEIEKITNNQIYLTFTMGVLQHIHPESNWVFKEISRITSNYIITFENESLYTIGGNFPRDYGKIFTELGWKLISTSIYVHNNLPVAVRVLKKENDVKPNNNADLSNNS